LQSLNFLVASRVVNDGDFRLINLKRRYQVRGEMGRGNERNIFRALVFQLFKDIRELGGGDRFAAFCAGNLVILAERAAKIAACKKIVPLPFWKEIQGSSKGCK